MRDNQSRATFHLHRDKAQYIHDLEVLPSLKALSKVSYLTLPYLRTYIGKVNIFR